MCVSKCSKQNWRREVILVIVDGLVYLAGSKGFPATAAGGFSVTMVRLLAAMVADGLSPMF